jgi:hypothetical protein
MILGLLNKLKEFLAEGTNPKQDVSLFLKNVSTILNELFDQLSGAFDKAVMKDEYLAVFEELCIGKKINLSKALQILLVKLYSLIVKNGQGFNIRSLVNSLLGVMNNKLTTWQGKECALDVLTLIMQGRLNDCASQSTDVLQTLFKFLKATNELPAVKIAILNCLTAMVSFENGKLSDIFQDVFKNIQRMGTTEKSADVRWSFYHLLHLMMQQNTSILTVEMVMPVFLKGLEVENDSAEVSDLISLAVAALHERQIRVYSEKQEQSKIGAARGGSDPNAPSTPTKGGSGTGASGSNPASNATSAVSSSLSRLTKLTSLKKVVVEEPMDFRSVVENQVVKNIWKSSNNNNLRTGYLFVLGNLIQSFLSTFTMDDLEWITSLLISICQDPTIQGLSYEDSNYFRFKLSFIFRNYFMKTLTEQQLIAVCQELIKYSSGLSSTSSETASSNNNLSATGNIIRSDLELLTCLNEIYHLLTVMGLSAQTIHDEVITCATIQLRHANFQIRLLSANILSFLTVLTPNLGNELLKTSLMNVQQQLKLLLSQLFVPNPAIGGGNHSPTPPMEAPSFDIDEDSSHPSTTTGAPVNRRKSIRENERLQRLYYFHGYSLTISMIIKNYKLIPNGISDTLLNDIMKIGLEMISQELLSVSVTSRHIICSIIRAGGLILSSCLTLEYVVIKERLPDILEGCKKILKLSEVSGSHSSSSSQMASQFSNPDFLASAASQHQTSGGSGGGVGNDEQIFEIMALESSLLCISSFLQTILHSTNNNNTAASNNSVNSHLQYSLFQIIELLEFCFMNFKAKYSMNFRSHYRYRNLYITLLENFLLLPSGSYPITSQQIYVESLRNFRDGITSGYECSPNFLLEDSLSYLLNSHSLGNGNNSHREELTTSFKHFPAMNNLEMIDSDKKITWRLESYMNSLSKKEYEAFTFMGNKDEIVLSLGCSYPFLYLSDNNYQLIDQNNLSVNEIHSNHYSSTAIIDRRMMNIAIKLISMTFPHQLAEYQDKAIQLFSQAINQLVNLTPTTASRTGKSSATSSLPGMSLFSNEEEKKKKEKKSLIILKNIVCGFASIVKIFPLHSGKQYELDYQWRQLLIDNLYALLVHPDNTIRYHSAQSLALFAMKWKGSNIISAVCSRIRSSIMSIYEKKQPSGSSSSQQDSSMLMFEFSGYAITLSHLWIYSSHLPEVQSLALTVSFLFFILFFFLSFIFCC